MVSSEGARLSECRKYRFALWRIWDENKTFKTPVNVNGEKIFADSTEADMYTAIDGLVDKLDRQVRKHKEKLVDHHARETRKRDFA